jgi:hypothetical protein
MNNTPKTDAQTGYAITAYGLNKNNCLYIDQNGPFVLAGVARELELENEKLRDIITRASVHFFYDGSDGDAASAMLKILNEMDLD